MPIFKDIIDSFIENDTILSFLNHSIIIPFLKKFTLNIEIFQTTDRSPNNNKTTGKDKFTTTSNVTENDLLEYYKKDFQTITEHRNDFTISF